MRAAVYEFFDQSGRRLYIGMTNDPRRRAEEHRHQAWWPLVDDRLTVIAWHPSREHAARIEARLIALHRPQHNTVVVGARRPVVGPVAWDATIEDIDWDAVVDDILRESSPLDRARMAGAALAEVRDWQVGLKWRRQACVAEMRDQGMSLADIGRELGLHRNRVQQIAEGRSSGGQGGKVDEA